MNHERRGWSAVTLLLTAIVALQAIGYALQSWSGETAAFEAMWLGLEVSEPVAQVISDVGVGWTLLASLFAIRHRARWLLYPVAGWFLLDASAETWMRGHRLSYLAVPAHASQILAPVVLAWWERLSPHASHIALQRLLRAAIGATFLAHGWEALRWHPRFVDYVVSASELLPGPTLADSTATLVVTAIGFQDLVLAALVLAGLRWRVLLGWMAIWAALAASARVVFGGWARYPAVLLRAANGGLPLTLLWLHSVRDESPTTHARD